MDDAIKTFLLAKDGEIKEIKLTEGITNLFDTPFLEQIAIMEPYMLLLIIYASEQKVDGYSDKELDDLLYEHNKYDLKDSKEYEINDFQYHPRLCKSGIDLLVDYGIFSKKYVEEHSEERYFLMPVFAEYFVDLRDSVDKGGPDFLPESEKFCARILMKDKFFETPNN